MVFRELLLHSLMVSQSSLVDWRALLSRVTWPIYDRNDPMKLVGTQTQVPLKLTWAMTVHKAQGTLDAVEVYCGKEFALGLSMLPCQELRAKINYASLDLRSII